MNRVGAHAFRSLAGAAAALIVFAFASTAAADERYAAIVIDARSNEVLLEDQADESRFPASLTKMMSLYLLFEALERGDVNLSTRISASRNAARQPPSRLGLRRGDILTVEQAIQALVVQSANDVAVAVAERLGGTEARFANQMNAKARNLGMEDTRFVNASGLPNPRQRSTARDMALLSQALWRDFPENYHYFQTSSFSYRRRFGRNHNRLLGQVDGVDGIKTGYTRASGFNLASSAERDGRRVIVVVMGGETAAARDAQVAYLIEGAFEEYARREDPNVAYANLPSQRLDLQLAPGVLNAGATQTAALTSAAPFAANQGVVIETLSPLRAPLDGAASTLIGQGDEGESSTEEPQ